MKTVVYVPAACKESTVEVDGAKVVVPATFSGSITLKVPTFFDRQKLKSMLVDVVAKDGEADIEALRTGKGRVNVLRLLDKIADLVRESIPFYQSVDLTNLKTGAKYSSFDDLSVDAEADEILQDVAKELAGGLSLSKNS